MKKTQLFFMVVISIITMNAFSQNTTKHPAYEFTVQGTVHDSQNPTFFLIQKIRARIGMYNYPDTSNIVPEVLASLTNLEQEITKISQEKIPQNFQVDIIGQTHIGGPFDDMKYQAELLQSQSMIKDIIHYEKYQLIGVEGQGTFTGNDSSGQYGLRTRYGMINSQLESNLLYTEKDYNVRSFSNSLETYYNFSNQQQMVGIEDSTIHYFNIITNGCGSPDCNEYACINSDIVVLRSHIAFYKMIQAMRGARKDRAVIVIGALHMKDFIPLMKNFGVMGNFYNTSFLSISRIFEE
jgi:hypothetical protein